MKSWLSSALGSLAFAALLLVLAAPAHAAHHGNPGAPTIPLVTPGGGSNPAVDATLHGTITLGIDLPGIAPMPAANFYEAPNTWIPQGDISHTITIGALAYDRGAIAAVKVCITGNCVSLSTTQTINPRTGDIGYNFIPTSIGATDAALADTCLYVTPVNGYQRKVCMTLNIDNNNTISRGTAHYADYANGNDANAGTSVSPWQHIMYGISASNTPDGGILYAKCPNTFVEDHYTDLYTGNANTKMIQVLVDPATCNSGNAPTITKTSRTAPQAGDIQLPVAVVQFDGFNWDMSKFIDFHGCCSSPQEIVWSGEDSHGNCGLIDPGGGSGGTYGYPLQDGSGNPTLSATPFNPFNSVQSYILDCPITTVNTSYITGVRNSTWSVGWDIVGNYVAGMWMENVRGSASPPLLIRYSLQDPTTVIAQTAITSSPGCPGAFPTGVKITFSAGITLFSAAPAAGDGTWPATVLGGASAGVYRTYSVNPDPTTPNIIICATAGINIPAIQTQGILFGNLAHADCLQNPGNISGNSDSNRVLDNVLVIRDYCIGNPAAGDIQSLLASSTDPNNVPSGTATTTGTAISFAAPVLHLAPLDCVNVVDVSAPGGQNHQYRVVKTVADSQHATLYSSFGANLSANFVYVGTPIINMAIGASIFDSSGGDSGLVPGCIIDSAFVQDTYTGTGGSGSLEMNNISNSITGGFGIAGVQFLDDILNGNTNNNLPSFYWDTPTGGGANLPAGFTFSNNQIGHSTGGGITGDYCSGANPCGSPEVHTAATFSPVSCATTGCYKPSGGTVTATLLGNGTVPLLPFGADGTSETLTSLIGAQGQ